MSAIEDPVKNHFAGGEPTSAEKASRQLEAFFIRRMLAEMRATVGKNMLSGGYSGEMFQEMLDEAFADQMSTAGGVGLADLVSADMEPSSLSNSTATNRSTTDIAIKQISSSRTPRNQTISSAHNMSRSYQAHQYSLQKMPLQATTVLAFGPRTDAITGTRSFHDGMDLLAPSGTKVEAAGPGIVVQAGQGGHYGNIVVIDHGGGLESRYAHLGSVSVHVGEQLAAGENLGTVGTDPKRPESHVHFQLLRRNKPIDPQSVLQIK